MEALLASYGSDSDSDESSHISRSNGGSRGQTPTYCPVSPPLPPPPLDFLDIRRPLEHQYNQVDRIRSFPHVDGNYALHVFIPVLIPSTSRKMVASFLKKVAAVVPDLNVVDVDIPLNDLCKADQKLEQVALGSELHISLGRTVPIRVHQIDSIVTMLRQKLQSQKRYWIEFNKWEVFVNDDQTRTFLSLEVTGGGLSQIRKQIEIVDSVYRLHGLPEFYKCTSTTPTKPSPKNCSAHHVIENPRPHVSLLWALGDISCMLKQAVGLNRCHQNPGSSSDKDMLFACNFSGIDCRIGKKSYRVCKVPEQ